MLGNVRNVCTYNGISLVGWWDPCVCIHGVELLLRFTRLGGVLVVSGMGTKVSSQIITTPEVTCISPKVNL